MRVERKPDEFPRKKPDTTMKILKKKKSQWIINENQILSSSGGKFFSGLG